MHGGGAYLPAISLVTGTAHARTYRGSAYVWKICTFRTHAKEKCTQIYEEVELSLSASHTHIPHLPACTFA